MWVHDILTPTCSLGYNQEQPVRTGWQTGHTLGKGNLFMDLITSILGLLLLAVIAFIVLRFVLRLTARIIGCVLTLIIILGGVAILLLFVF